MKTVLRITSAAFDFATDVLASSILGGVAGALAHWANPAAGWPVAVLTTVVAMTYLAVRDLDAE